MQRNDGGREVVTVTVSARRGQHTIKGKARSTTVYDAPQPEVWALVDAALDLDSDTLWALVQHGAPLADTSDNRAALWDFFLSRGHAASPVQVDP